jgi:hypothetical protein
MPRQCARDCRVNSGGMAQLEFERGSPFRFDLRAILVWQQVRDTYRHLKSLFKVGP